MRGVTESPGEALVERENLELRLGWTVRREMRRFLAYLEGEAEASVGSPGPLLAAASPEPVAFTLNTVQWRWNQAAHAVGEAIAAALGESMDDLYMRQVTRRLLDSPVSGQAYAAVREALQLSQAQAWTQARTVRELRSTLGVGKDSQWAAAAQRIARTEATGAYGHRASVEMAERGVALKRWVAHHDHRTRPSHATADGQTVPPEQAFIVGGYALDYPGDPAAPLSETASCFPADMSVYGQVTGGMRRRYSGPMCLVEVGGQQLAGTPNHPVLTESGWVPLGSVEAGDYLIGHSRQGQSSIAHDVEADPAPICEVFDALSVAFEAVRVGTSRMDFHGDGSESEVDVVGADGELSNAGETPADEFLRQGALPLADMASGGLDSDGASGELFSSTGRSPGRVVGGARVGRVLLSGSGGGKQAVGGKAPPGLYPVLDEQSTEGDASPADFASQGLLGLAGQITRQKVSHVGRISVWQGHVFNLSTVTGAYVCNGIIVHNCRCVLVRAASPLGSRARP